MSNLQIFENPEFGTVRTITVEGKPYFVGKDVADILGYQNGSRDINRHVDEEDRHKVMLFDGNQDKETIIINESGLYSLILSSKMPKARQFKHWVTAEVLPSIRKHGAYITSGKLEEIMNDPDSWIQLLTTLKGEREEKKKLEAKVEQDRPKVLFADAVDASRTSILIGDLAKLIKQNGVDIGQKRLFAWMRENGFLMKSGSSTNMPTQKAMDMKLFEVKERTFSNPDGSIRTTKTTKVTGKGQQYFINRFLGDKHPADKGELKYEM